MKFSVVSVLALASGALAGAYSNDTVVYETITTTALTTWFWEGAASDCQTTSANFGEDCPSATTIVHGTQTYTVTEATTLTITDCPCTFTQPIISKPTPSTVLYTSCPPTSDAGTPATYPAGPPAASGPVYSNPLTTYPAGAPTTKPAGATKPIGPEKPSGTASYATPATSYPATFTGAASAHQVGGGLVVGAAAAALAAFAL
ncbi:mmc protein [Drepanopeziza brunnea f. sp. 'multigermtubi' MB_m1]|uniref:Mmc protein n=1 Tax=Marssonina brunnea f. sp. multigermtubi (strain MB_m1) TaxID=1072389 RepID=K1WSQ5_MARBU|nr:mmc protein [Drepanopeziza brunnea f. sp. 'multigermtubi' MB_m1]EKD15457.1 mmc protein [Drepanopeziza brunnea f. sp. 'multigermtubi' MB_m1]